MSSKWEYDAALRYLDIDQRVIEIGCGAGDFIAQMRDKGIIAEGIELNPSAVASARSRNLPVHQQDLQNAAIQNPSGYDVVCAFQVLEHISQPFEFLSWCCDLLKPGGQLIIAVPNSDSMFKHTFDILDLPPHHLTKWSRLSLENLPNLFPIRLREIFQSPLEDYHIETYVNSLAIALSGMRHARNFFFSRAQRVLVGLIRYTGMRRFLVGHTILAIYTKSNKNVTFK
jgi:SAM-dependent methyltransferase